MPHRDHYLKIRDFLLPYRALWQEEVLMLYPDRLGVYGASTAAELGRLSDEELWKADSGVDLRPLAGTSIGALFERSLGLQAETTPPPYRASHEVRLPLSAFQHVRPKKRHELERIAPLFNDWKQEFGIDKLVDIGGGVGHLARVAHHHCGLLATYIDADAQVLSSGRERLAKYPEHEDARPVQFKEMRFPAPACEMHGLIDSRTMVVGLHTCGPLAVEQLRVSHQMGAGGLLNFGCCYHKIEDQGALNLSRTAQQAPLPWTPYALTLATRAHRDFSFQDFLDNRRVKFHRYALHLLLHELGQREFIAVGEAPNKGVYFAPFGQYAATKLRELDLWPGRAMPGEEECQAFFDAPATQAKLQELFCLNMVRWRFGRLLEMAILLDRVLFMQDLGYEAQACAFFDEKLSPRNLGLIARLALT